MAEPVVTNDGAHGPDGDDATRRDFIHIAAGAMAAGAGVMAVWPLVIPTAWFSRAFATSLLIRRGLSACGSA